MRATDQRSQSKKSGSASTVKGRARRSRAYGHTLATDEAVFLQILKKGVDGAHIRRYDLSQVRFRLEMPSNLVPMHRPRAEQAKNRVGSGRQGDMYKWHEYIIAEYSATNYSEPASKCQGTGTCINTDWEFSPVAYSNLLVTDRD